MKTIVAALLLSLLAQMNTALAALPPAKVPDTVNALESNVARQGYFYVGGRYVGEGAKQVMIGQMYVEMWAPREVKKPYPIVFFHGASSTGTTWMQTPDGRRDRKSTRLNSSHVSESRMPSSA